MSKWAVQSISKAATHCTMRWKVLLVTAGAARVISTQEGAFSTTITVPSAAPVAHWRWWRWCRWWWPCGRWCRWCWCRWGWGCPIQVEGGEGRHLRPPQGHDSALSCRWWWGEKMVKWARWAWRWWSRGSVHLSQCDLAGSCPLVAASPQSCSPITATLTTCCLVAPFLNKGATPPSHCSQPCTFWSKLLQEQILVRRNSPRLFL